MINKNENLISETSICRNPFPRIKDFQKEFSASFVNCWDERIMPVFEENDQIDHWDQSKILACLETSEYQNSQQQTKQMMFFFQYSSINLKHLVVTLLGQKNLRLWRHKCLIRDIPNDHHDLTFGTIRTLMPGTKWIHFESHYTLQVPNFRLNLSHKKSNL